MSHEQSKVRNKSYAPKPSWDSYAVPYEMRGSSLPPETTEIERKITELRREHCIAQYGPEVRVGDIDLKEGWLIAVDLLRAGFVVAKAVAEFNGDVTVNQIVGEELTDGKAGQEHLDLAFENGALIGPNALLFPNELVVLQGVALWIPAEQRQNNITVA